MTQTPVLLPTSRIAGYLGALRAGLNALGPNADFVPLPEARATLQLLDPALCGDLLDPAEADPRSGMPASGWFNRATGLVRATRGSPPPTPDQIARARELDPVLGARLQTRASLHRFAEGERFLPGSRLQGAIRRRGATTDFLLTFDRITPDALWLRVRVDLTGPAGWEARGPIQLLDDGSVQLDDGLRHLLGRHLLTPVTALRLQIQDGVGALVSRLSRCVVGPFWFPGVPLPFDVPPELGSGLVLHASSEVLGLQVRTSAHADPLTPPPAEPLAEGYGVFRDRRFAASAALVQPLSRWSAARGCRVVVHDISRRG